MVRDPFGAEDAPDLEPVLDALNGLDCRRVVHPLDRLTEASILREGTVVRTDGRHTTESALAFEGMTVFLDESRKFEVAITRPATSAERQLAGTRSEVRKET